MRPDREEQFVPPPGSDAHLLHHQNFYASVRARRPSIEDVVFGFRAAGPGLLTNVSYFERRVCGWDAGAMQRAATAIGTNRNGSSLGVSLAHYPDS